MVSPRSTGLACPVSLYGEKTVPPRRSERNNTPTTRRRRHAPGSGPNHRRSLRRQRRRTPPSAIAIHVSFKRPKRLRRLIKWTLPSLHISSAEVNCDGLVRPHVNDDVIPQATDLTIDDDSNDESSRDEATTADAKSATDQQAEWEDATEDNDNSRDSMSATSLEGNKQSSTMIRHSNKSKKVRQEFIISKMLTQNAHGL